jgi:hypothetical protein
VRVADAPPAGWYPDPSGRTRLRWWDGLDWSDDLRSVPRGRVLAELEELRLLAAADTEGLPDRAVSAAQFAARRRSETDEIIAQVRDIARTEVDRAADVFSQRAEAATRRIQPLVTEYTSQVLRWVRIALALALLMLVTWFVLQFVIQASLFEWIGDRIDNLTNE